MHIAEQMYMSKQKQNQIKAKYKVKQFKEGIDTATNWIINECFGRPGRFPGIAETPEITEMTENFTQQKSPNT